MVELYLNGRELSSIIYNFAQKMMIDKYYHAGIILCMDFKTYYRSLNREQRARFAEVAETSVEYIEIHLISRRKVPKKDLMQRLAQASDGKLSYLDLVEFFDPELIQQLKMLSKKK